MPPKSSSLAWLPRRIIRTTARKSVPAIPSKCTSLPKSTASPSSFQDNHLTPPPTSSSSASSTANPSPEFSQNDSGLLSSPTNKRTFQRENSSLGEWSPPVSFNAGPQEKALIPVSPDKINLGDDTQEETPAGTSNLNAEVEITPTNSIPADGQERTTQAGHETLIGCGKARIGADGRELWGRVGEEGG